MNSETPEAILFLNYRQPRTFTESDKTRARSSLRALQPLIAPVLRQLAEEDREWLADAARIVQPASSITSNDVVGPKLDRYYRRILDSALEALGLSGITGIGMLHLYDHDRLTLTLETFTGCVEQTANTECLSVTTGTGVQSWVVRHRRALLLTDVATSKFQPIHVPLAPEVKSELAVPIEVDGDLVGVLSLQCTEPKRFKPHHVRSVWYVANRLGIVHRLHAQANLNREFLQICAETTTKALDPKAPLRHIAHLAARHFRAHSCRLWSYDPRRGQLVHSAWGDGTDSSDESRVGPRVRSRGFSADILKWQQPLWLTNINTEASFKVYRWLPAGWHPLPADRSALKTVNVSLKGDRIRCQAGLPIQFQGRCIGVAWVKFVRDHEPPGDAWMRLAQGFVSAAGLILDAVRRSTSRRLPRS